MTQWPHKHLTDIYQLTHTEVIHLFERARFFKKNAQEEIIQEELKRKIVINFFAEASTRTRAAFEIAARKLSADVINLDVKSSSLTKGESLQNTAEVLEALGADMIVLRHASSGSAQYLSQRLETPLINGGDGSHGHPSQALLDTFTLHETFQGDFSGKQISIIGDLLFSRVARSNIELLQKMGAKISLAGPPSLVPKTFEQLGCHIKPFKEALSEADAVILLRVQHERQNSNYFPSLKEYRRQYSLDKTTEKYLKDDTVILHPGPVNLGVEISSELANSPKSQILKQVSNGIFVRMAILDLCYQSFKNEKERS